MSYKNRVRKAGLVGGMGPQSTMPYYMGVVGGVRERTAPDFFPPLVIDSVNVFEVLGFCARGDWDGMTAHLLGAIRNLAAAGADFAVLTANTAHLVLDRLRPLSPLPLLSIVDATVAEARRRGYGRVALLGTVFTMTSDLYRRPMAAAGIEVVTPIPDEMRLVDHRITSELELGVARPETLAEFQTIIRRLRTEAGAEAAVLGCTELPLLLNDANSPLPVLDTVAIHTRAIVDAILGEGPAF